MPSKWLLSALVAATLVFCAAQTQAAVAPARPADSVSYGAFHSTLAAHGQWMHNARWGDVWRPGISGFRPYFDRGHWAYTADYGWYWDADDDWGDIVFHYGRWVFDPADGWVWIPGYVWGPGWVMWRWGDGYAGWMPEPPDYAFLTGGIDLGIGFGAWDVNFYGYQDWYGGAVAAGNLWFFVGAGHLADPGFQRFAVPRERVADFIARTRNVTHFTLHNGFVANRSISVRSVERLSGRRIAAVSARSLVHSRFAALRANTGVRTARVERAHHPLPANTVKSVRQVRRTTTVRTAHGTTRHVTRTTSLQATTRHAHTYAARSTTTTHHYTARSAGMHHYSARSTRARSFAQHGYRTPSTAHAAPYHSGGYAHQSFHPMTGFAHPSGGRPSGGFHGAPSHAAPVPSGKKPPGH